MISFFQWKRKKKKKVKFSDRALDFLFEIMVRIFNEMKIILLISKFNTNEDQTSEIMGMRGIVLFPSSPLLDHVDLGAIVDKTIDQSLNRYLNFFL